MKIIKHLKDFVEDFFKEEEEHEVYDPMTNFWIWADYSELRWDPKKITVEDCSENGLQKFVLTKIGDTK